VETRASAAVAKLIRQYGPTVISRRIGCTLKGANDHATGTTPRLKVRQLYRDHYGIALEDWERPDGPPEPPRSPPDCGSAVARVEPIVEAPAPPPLPAGPTATPDALQTVVSLLAETRELIAEARRDLDTPYAAKAALIASATRLTQLLAKMTGSMEVTQSMIVRSSSWGRILRAFETVFSRHPEASQALTEFAKELAEMGE